MRHASTMLVADIEQNFIVNMIMPAVHSVDTDQAMKLVLHFVAPCAWLGDAVARAT